MTKKKKQQHIFPNKTSHQLPRLNIFGRSYTFYRCVAAWPTRLLLESCQFHWLTLMAQQHASAILITINTASCPTEITVSNSSENKTNALRGRWGSERQMLLWSQWHTSNQSWLLMRGHRKEANLENDRNGLVSATLCILERMIELYNGQGFDAWDPV